MTRLPGFPPAAGFGYDVALVRSGVEQFFVRVIRGEARGPGPGLLRALLRAAEPFYAAAVVLRNHRLDRGHGVRHLPRPVLSVGNLTAGGTGKTPLVLWLCRQLAQRGLRVGVLLRGYKSTAHSPSDEKIFLENHLQRQTPPAIVCANPDRWLGGQQVLAQHPDVDLFVLDDGFQHRRLFRDFDLVLIDACNPFGYGHLHPRGLLREPPQGLRRAHAIVLTRAGEVDAAQRDQIVQQIRQYNPTAPIYLADHVQTALLRLDGSVHPLSELAGRKCFAFCALGNPQSFSRGLQSLPASIVGQRWFEDHHPYTAPDLESLRSQARAAGADLLLTSEKDGVKVNALQPQPGALEVAMLQLELVFASTHQADLLAQILSAIGK